ncbi:PAS domain S-box protein [Bacillus weihaiensis]|uniref:PAS domain S-box protein n=1 Tax=Bacillus weihaiensis TaxID=1547283 RepID=UPI002352E9C0|nr:PAS domain S-box protein [Bacillus weihaiensis]
MNNQSAETESLLHELEIYAVVSSNGRFQYVSSNSLELTGYRNDELIGKSIKNFIHQEDLFLIESYFFNEHHLYPCSFRFQSRTIDYIWFEASVEFIKSTLKQTNQEIILKMRPLNKPVFTPLGPARIMKERKLPLLDLKKISGDMILEDLPTPLLLTLKGDICYVNKSFQDLIGADTKHQLVGHPIYEFIEASFHEIVKTRIERLHEGEKIGIIEQTWKRFDGSVINVEVTTALTAFRGEYAEMIVLTDISSKRNFQKILQKSRERYQRLIDNSIDMIGVIHQDRWVFVNEAGIRLFQAEDYHQLMGKNIFQDLHPKDHTSMRTSLKSILEGKVEVDVSNQSWLIDSEKILYTEMVFIPTTYFGEKAVQVILRDISERKKTEELMLRSEKLSIAGQLAAGIAHEIRNPLTAIKGFLQMMKPDFTSHQQYFDIVFSELNRIELILSELLMLAKPQETKFIRRNIVSLLQDVAMLLETQANMKSVYIEQVHEDFTLEVDCDENQLKQVFINLFKNAIDAMPEGGKVSVYTRRNNNKMIIEVRDEGEGISSELMERIGEPFLTTKEKGNGLGLMITYKIIEEHGGNILIDSELGKGTTFFVEMPIHT